MFNLTLGLAGAERVTVHLSNYFLKQGSCVHLITAKKLEKEHPLPSGIERHNIGCSGKNVIKQIVELRKFVKKYKPDVVITMDSMLSFISVIALLGTKTPLIISERSDPAYKFEIPIERVYQYINQYFFPIAQGHVFQTFDAKTFYKRCRKNTKIIFNPLVLDTLPTAIAEHKTKNIVTIGRLSQQKNHKLLITAFSTIASLFPEYTLTIHGEGPLREELEKLINELNLETRVFLCGSSVDVLEKIIDASLFVFSSDYEGMPNALLEAMALGLPCISTDCPCGGPRAVITDGLNGKLVPVGDVEILADTMKYLLTNTDVAKKMGENAVKIRKELHIDKIGKQWDELIAETLNQLL